MTNLIHDAYDNYPAKQKDSKKTNNSLTPYEFYLAACELRTGQHGSFAEAIGEAYIVADKGNSQNCSMPSLRFSCVAGTGFNPSA